jgi:cbb3-type cytochrome oxidase cytochrome c subunit
MPATEEYARSLRSLHVVSAVSAVALFGATMLMMRADYADEWRGIQKVATEAEAEKIDEDLLRLTSADFNTELERLQSEVKKGEDEVASANEKVAPVRAKVNELEGKFQYLSREAKFQNAKRGKAGADFDLRVRDDAPVDQLKQARAIFKAEDAKAEEMRVELEKLQDELDRNTKELAKLTKPRDDAVAALKKFRTELERLTKVKAKIAPEVKSEPVMAAKRWLMELPIIEGFNGPVRINQIWLPELTVVLGMKETARYDRCITCHVNIDKVKAGNVADYPHDPHGISLKNYKEYFRGKAVTTDDGKTVTRKTSRLRPDGSVVGYDHPFSTHPNPDLYLTASSPHPMQKFGCTSCHEGQGSGTSFQNASHSPNSPDIAEKWKQEYGYSFNHFWEMPMYPERLREASCLKCHHNVVELGVNPKFGASAPKLFKGYELIRQYGCFGCHEINGYAAGKPIGPDMRLEPQTEEEAERIAADPLAVAGTMRKVGPGLRHFAAKTTIGWAENWVEDPRRFRPDTRMPQFFHLTNQEDKQAKELQPVEIAGMVKFLFDKSETMKLEKWDASYTPDAERGKLLFAQRGCGACHSHDDLPGNKADFGPNLTNAHQKISSAEWLYTWLRDPTRHSSRTRMPNLYLEPETANGVTVDAAADIAAFLLVNRDDQGKAIPGPDGKLVRDEVGPKRFTPLQTDKEALNKLARLYLGKVMSTAKLEDTLKTGKYPESDAAAIRASATKPDEIELIDGPITDESLLRYVGRRTISRYGCYGCHDIPGFEKARPIGTGLFDWGRKDPTKLALEHIENYLHHHGEADGSSTAERAERSRVNGINDNFQSAEERDRETAVGYFFDQLNHHGRAGFLWQKLRDPRSYDYKKIETKGYDERLRMPKFPFSESDIEAITTFVVGLVAEPPAEKYVYRPNPAAKARIEGEKLLTKYNCTGCHMVELPKITGLPEDLTPYELADSDFQEGLDLLLKLNKPRDARTNLSVPGGQKAISFHGMLFQRPNPDDDPDDQAALYDLWEVISLDGKDQLLVPPNRIEIKTANLLSETAGRGGAFAEWLVEGSVKGQLGPKVDRGVAREMAPPTLYKEGIKVQTPWLYAFLKNPDRLRYTTVLRMPQFNMSNEEAGQLANYFAAVDNAAFPYQEIPQREPAYLEAREQAFPDYLHQAWGVITKSPATGGVCAGCHAVGGRPFVGGGKDVTRGPDLDRVYSRLQPDWLQLWMYNPKWITPYTRMPQNFTRNKDVFPELFGGKGEVQATGSRDALMNYFRLLEKEGKATAAAPGEVPPAEGGKQ